MTQPLTEPDPPADRGARLADPRRPEKIAELFATAATENETILRLTGCVADLNAAQAAKQMLSTLSAAEVRAALKHRRRSLREAQW